MVVCLVVAAVVALYVQASRDSRRNAESRSSAAAESFAGAPGTVAALESDNPSTLLQPRAAEVRAATGIDALYVLGANGTLYAGYDPDTIGQHVPVDLRAFFASGRSHTETYDTGSGGSVVTAVPVYAADGTPLGVVTAGITFGHVNAAVRRQIPLVAGGAAAALVVAVAGTALVSRRLRRQTRGLGPAEITRVYEHHDAVLHAVREGVLIIDGDQRVVLANDEARRLLDLPPDVEGRPLASLHLVSDLTDMLASGRDASDEVHFAGDRLLAVNQRRTEPYGPSGTVVTLRDTTELRALAGHAQAIRERLDLLYEASLRIGTSLDVSRTATELADVAAPRFADGVSVDLRSAVLHGDEPDTADPHLHRVVALWRGAPGASPLDVPDGTVDPRERPEMTRALERGHAVLADGDAVSIITVPLQARGVVLGLASFWRGSTTEPFDEDDVTLAEELTVRAAVSIDNARRFTREHSVAVALQRSLLPQELPDVESMDVASRYLPADSGVGGDWFDVIPLPGARIALVVGDVVGHGLHAAATMGRLRTAVHNFSALDLAPEEMLGRLDDLAANSDLGVSDTSDVGQLTGATCLYAVYDTVSGRVVIASAGHPGPALVTPDGVVSFPRMPVSPPLGLGAGLPIQTARLTLAPGSRLVLFTDGLVERRGRDLDVGLEMLEGALAGAGPGASPETTCDAVTAAMVPDRHRTDDVALLVARTDVLAADRVVVWDVEDDPASVGRVRAACARQLDAWGLGDVAFAAELILSELVTNAIRYGRPPLRVRVVRERMLVFEVSDASSTSPHLRRASSSDEGGRGLFLVARYAARWGTRYHATGKTIWAELPFAAPRDAAGAQSADDLLDQWDDAVL